MAQSVGAAASDIHLRAEASETMLGNLSVEEGRTVLMITHDSGLVKEGSRVVHIRDGRLGDESHNLARAM